jgi:hypothetical protein
LLLFVRSADDPIGRTAKFQRERTLAPTLEAKQEQGDDFAFVLRPAFQYSEAPTMEGIIQRDADMASLLAARIIAAE